ncbi:MAG TPA: DUF6090 family protein [Flavobacteriaceae bacterium]|nr:DUF6090 family protein [Flavobacteriaceae bacterium]
MIKFFRNIRQNMINKNRATNYLLYAIGEIVLVVIGILIALQINNANEQRKERLKAKVYIEKIIRDLEADTTNLNGLIELGERTMKSTERYFNYYENSDDPIETLTDSANQVYTGINRYLPIDYTFRDMQSSGNTTLLTDEQKSELIELSNLQTYYQIVIEKGISSIFSEAQEMQKYLDYGGWAKTDFFEKLGVPQDKKTKAQGLFHKHNELWMYHNMGRGYVNLSKRIKTKTIEVLKVLKQTSN